MARTRNRRRTSEQYWKQRTEQLEREWNTKSQQEIERELKDYYRQSMEHIQKNVNDLYARFAKENGLDMVAAQRLLQGKEFRTWRMDMKEYLEQIEATGNPRLLRELNTLTMRSRISRLDKLYGETLVECAKLAEKTGRSFDRFLPSAYKDFYYRNLYGIAKQGALRNPVSAVDPQRLENVLRVPWSGKNYSQRIWNNNEDLAKAIQKVTVDAMHRGASVQDLSRMVAQKMSVGYNDAERLVRTELNYVENQASLDSIKDAGFEYYTFLATLDNRTSAQCREHDGLVFPVGEARPGTNMPPLHPRCRSTISASFGEGKDSKGRRIARNSEGRNIHVPADMNYADWKSVFVDKTQTMREWRVNRAAAAKSASAASTAASVANLAKNGESILYVDDVDEHIYTKEDIFAELDKSWIGRDMKQYLEESDATIRIIDEKQSHFLRGEQEGNNIRIYSTNIKNKSVLGQTVVHELTHYRYHIGRSQRAEVMCFGMEKMHLYDKVGLSRAEWKELIKKIKAEYHEYKWRVGGYGDYSQFDFLRR